MSKNGINRREPKANLPGLLRTEVFHETKSIKVTSIISTPMRVIDLVEAVDGMFVIRETAYSSLGGHSVSVQNVWLKPHEITKLRDVLSRVVVLEGGES